MNKIAQLALIITLIGFTTAAIGCRNTSTTSEHSNDNTAIVTNTNTTASPTPSNTNLTREEFDKDKGQYEREAKALGRKVGSGANDLWLWAKTRTTLATVDDLKDSAIDVDVENGIVTLSGKVAGAAQKTSAEQIAKKIEGVKSVKNKISISAKK